MRKLLAAMVPVLMLSAGPAFALNATADLLVKYAPDRSIVPATLMTAQVEFGTADGFDGSPGDVFGKSDDVFANVMPGGGTQAPDPSGPLPEPVVPDGWQRLEKLGLRFALPPEFHPVLEDDDVVMLVNAAELKPPACAIRIEYADDHRDDIKSEDGYAPLPDQKAGFGVTLSGGRMSGEEGGIHVDGAALFTDRPIYEDEHLAITISCAEMPAGVADTLIAQVFPTLALVEAPPAPEAEPLPLGGMISGQVPGNWSVYASNSSAWIVIAPGLQAAVNFRIGLDARSALQDLAPDRRSRYIADAVIERARLFGADGWLFTGAIPPDNPEHGVYNGGMAGPSSYFFTDRCTPDGEPLVVSFSAQQSWIDKGNAFAPFLDTVQLNWPEGPSPCEDGVASAMAKAVDVETPVAGATQPSVFDAPATDPFGTLQDDPAPPSTPTLPQTAQASGDGNQAVELAFWNTIKDSTDPADFDAYLAQFPNGAFAALALNRLNRYGAESVANPATILGHKPMEPPPPQGPNGTYDTSWGPLTVVTDAGGAVSGDYENGQSHIGGTLQGTTFAGRWLEPSSGRKCEDGAYWGRLSLDFTADFAAFDGKWGYCEDEPTRDWSGSRSGPAGAVQGLPHPVADPMPVPAPVPASQPSGLPPVPVADSFVTPQRGEPLRQALMDAARPAIAADIGQTVLFVVQELRTDGQWAYLQATPTQPSGLPLDWSRTNYATDWQADAMSDIVMVLLARQNGAWQVVDYIVGPTDVYWYTWIERFGLPEALFFEG